MRRLAWLPMIAVSLILGCGGAETPPPTSIGTTVEPGTSSTASKPDPTPVLPIPDNAPGVDPDAASKVPIKPIPDEPVVPQ
ncbi:MAG TPA: hypothetical protein VM165_26080 [Planctomycetaceae bacterium]|nr:hypothetical protein [Planctomycetaceae bacterium]